MDIVFNEKDIEKKVFDDRWVRFAFGSQGKVNTENLNLGIALAMTGDEEEARARLQTAVKTLPSGSLREQARKWLTSMNEPPEAVE